MKIAILSDIHDNIWNLAVALPGMQQAEAMICCGDLCSPFIVGLLAHGFPDREIHIVFGNNDGDLYRITENAHRFENVHLYGAFFEQPLGSRKFAVNHYPDIALAIAKAGKHDVVCYGHNHDFDIASEGNTLMINPGTIMGYHPVKQKNVDSTFVIYDTEENRAMGYRIAPPSESAAESDRITPYTGT